MTVNVYISGQITGLELSEARFNFKRAEEFVIDQGLIPVNPFYIQPCQDQKCHPEGVEIKRFPDGSFQHAYECYMKHDIKALLDCQMIAMLPNWHRSQGAGNELTVAKVIGLKVKFFNSDYTAWEDPRKL